MESGPTPGFFGKVPVVGDFVSRRLPRDFLDPWDEWLQGAIAGSRQQLGESWLDAYLTSPIWRFALSAGVAGPLPSSGIMMPSVDKAGRYFPLTLATILPAGVNLFRIAGNSQDWFESAESVALSVLEEETSDIESLDAGIDALGPLVIDETAEKVDPAPARAEHNSTAWHLCMQSVAGVIDILPELVQQLAESHFGNYSIWWSAGSEQIEPSMLVCEGLPHVEGYSAMLGGGWPEYGWYELAAAIAPADRQPETALDTCS